MNPAPQIDHEPPPPSLVESPFWHFEVQCLACGSFHLRWQGDIEKTDQPRAIWLICAGCGHREKLPVQ